MYMYHQQTVTQVTYVHFWPSGSDPTAFVDGVIQWIRARHNTCVHLIMHIHVFCSLHKHVGISHIQGAGRYPWEGTNHEHEYEVTVW